MVGELPNPEYIITKYSIFVASSYLVFHNYHVPAGHSSGAVFFMKKVQWRILLLGRKTLKRESAGKQKEHCLESCLPVDGLRSRRCMYPLVYVCYVNEWELGV